MIPAGARKGATRRALIALAVLGLACATAASHAATQTRTPSACASDASIGSVPWTNPGNAFTSNDSYATLAISGSGTTTEFLRCTGYGFAIPAGATINGITVDVERKSSSTAAGGSQDAAVRIVQGGVIGAADRATATVYTTADVIEAHGSATDLWGLAWTVTEINAAGFGAAFAAKKNSAGGGTHTLSVDMVRITVDYTPDTTPPVVNSIVRADPNPTTASTVRWSVTFSEPVANVDAGDFALAVSGLSGSSIASVSGGPTVYTVTANTGFGSGTIGLNLVDNDSITDVAGNLLGGAGAGNGNFTGEVYDANVVAPVSSFNVVEPGANAVSGRLFTKVAAQNMTVDIVALDASNNVATSFTGTVAVELVDNTSGGACSGLPLIKTLDERTFVAADNGRHNVPASAGQFEAEARRNVKFRISYPTSSPTVVACSSDAFANRPLSFGAVQARHANRTSAGTTFDLDSTANPGAELDKVHNAGRPFRIDATAQNAAAATTTLYAPDAGEPQVVLTTCTSGTPACTAALGALSLGTWSAAAGTITTTTATYSEAGAFALELEDRTFASVDAGDGTSAAVRYIRSAAPLTVGRFVPDHFTLEAGSSITPRAALAGCGASTFTYLGERLDLVFTLRARAAGGALTQNYDGTLAALALNSAASYGFGAIDSTVPTPLTARLDLSLIPLIGASWSAGTANVSAPLAVTRNVAPDGPYAAVRLGIAPSDPDAVALASFDLDADNNGIAERAQVGAPTGLRFGRLRLGNASGSEKLDLPVPLRVQYWDGKGWATNSADDCTTLNVANLSLGDYAGGVTAANTPASNLVLGGAFSAGVGSLTLNKPSPAPGTPGAVTLTVDLTAEGKSYLKGNWGVATYTADPTARLAFGVWASQPNQFIYFRENY